MSEHIRVMLPEEEIESRIKELGEEISRDYKGEEVYLIGVLRGAAFFTCELAKRITVPVTLDFLSTSSYGSGTVSSGNVKLKQDVEISPEGKKCHYCRGHY